MIRLAIFADVHGKVLLPFKLVDLYQKETGNKVDVILQCGDIAAFPNLDNLDKATLKYAQFDRDELGFYDYFTQENHAIRKLLDNLDVNMVCVRGNHEDHDYLDNLEKVNSGQTMFTADIYKRVWFCKSGITQVLKFNDEAVTLVGIGRIGDRKGRTDKRFIQEYERDQIKKLVNTGDIYDILLTHDKDDASQRGYGMKEIREVLDNVIFRYHFYGHTGEPFKEETDYNGITQSIKVYELKFDEDGMLPYGCMIILEKQQNEWQMSIVKQSITNKFTKINWKIK